MTPRPASQDRQTKPLVLLLVVGFMCVTGLSAGRELYRRNQVKDDLSTLETRVSQLEARKVTVSALLEQLKTQETIDREARLRLNMQKPGERVYMLRGTEWEQIAKDTAISASPSLYQETVPEPERSNPERWFRLFFVHDAASS